ncbi:MAG: four helix bundle protein [Clostridia bacterium]
MVSKQEQENKLQLIPKTEKYIEYMLQIIFKLPRTEKFSIGTEYKQSLYQTLENIMMISKIDKKNILNYLNKIDALLNTQRIYLRIMKKNKWIDERKFKIAMEHIYELGKILGGLIKYYAKNNKESI